MRKVAGFSILEIIAVLVMISILTTIAVPVYRSYQVRTAIGKAMPVLDAMRAEIDASYSLYGTLPTSVKGISGQGVYAGRDVGYVKAASNGFVKLHIIVPEELSYGTTGWFTVAGIPNSTSGYITWYCGAWSSAQFTAGNLPTTCTYSSLSTSPGGLGASFWGTS